MSGNDAKQLARPAAGDTPSAWSNPLYPPGRDAFQRLVERRIAEKRLAAKRARRLGPRASRPAHES